MLKQITTTTNLIRYGCLCFVLTRTSATCCSGMDQTPHGSDPQPPYWASLGFADAQQSRLFIGDPEFSENNEARVQALAFYAQENQLDTCLAFIVDMAADKDWILRHLIFLRELISTRRKIMLFTSDFKKKGIRNLFHHETIHWNGVRQLYIQVDSNQFVHCLGVLRFFPAAKIEECTIYLDSIDHALEGTPFDTSRLVETSSNAFPSSYAVELILCREPIRNPHLFSANFKWVKILLYKMNAESFRLSFNEPLYQSEIDLFSEALMPVWQFESSTSAKGTQFIHDDDDENSEVEYEEEFIVVFNKYKDKQQEYLYSRNAWIKANRFWVEHAKQNPH